MLDINSSALKKSSRSSKDPSVKTDMKVEAVDNLCYSGILIR